MPARGDVLRFKARLGFGAKAVGESVVVVQADRLNSMLETLVVVPLDPATDLFAGMPGAVPVPAAEAGSTVAHVAVATHLRVIRADALAPGVIGHLRPLTLGALNRAIRLILDA